MLRPSHDITACILQGPGFNTVYNTLECWREKTTTIETVLLARTRYICSWPPGELATHF
jgi:hypothetical protein